MALASIGSIKGVPFYLPLIEPLSLPFGPAVKLLYQPHIMHDYYEYFYLAQGCCTLIILRILVLNYLLNQCIRNIIYVTI
jgi:hypothetical protein